MRDAAALHPSSLIPDFMKERRNLIFLLAWLTAYAGLLFFFKHE